MTREDRENVLHCLKVMIDEEVCEKCNLYGTTGTDHCEKDCVRMAIQMLAKQIPKKVIYTADGYANGHLCYDYAECPICGNDEYEEGINNWEEPYCPKCGQALDWSMEAEEE